MKINPVKSSSFNTVTNESICNYIADSTAKINSYNKEQLTSMSRTALKQIAAQLETVCKELDYHVNGRY